MKQTSRKARQEAWDRAEGLCEECGRKGVWVHHIIPKRMGGTNNPKVHSSDNLKVLCNPCHAKAHGRRVV